MTASLDPYRDCQTQCDSTAMCGAPAPSSPGRNHRPSTGLTPSTPSSETLPRAKGTSSTAPSASWTRTLRNHAAATPSSDRADATREYS